MAIDTISPVADSQLDPGDSFSFRVDDTYTSITVEVETAGGWEYAYDSSLSGAQAGYTVAVTIPTAGRHLFTVTRTAGWNLSPFSIRVVENETGSDATTTTNYTLYSANDYPQTSDPYFLQSIGDSFLAHYDTPSSYAGKVGYYPRVKATADGLEFVDTQALIDARGDVFGPASALDNAIARYDLTTGKLLQGSLATIDDTGKLLLVSGLSLNNTDIEGLRKAQFQEGAGVSTPASGFVYLYAKTDGKLYIKDDTGTETDLTTGGGGGGGEERDLGKRSLGNTTIGATASGTFDTNNATPSLVTQIRINVLSDMVGFFDDATQTGTLKLRQISDPDVFIIYDVTAIADVPSYGKDFTVAYRTASGSFAFSGDHGVEYRGDADSGGSGDVVGPASSTDGTFAQFDGTTGKLLKNQTAVSWNGTQLVVDGSGTALRMKEGASSTGIASYGNFWVKNDTPSRPRFTDDTNVEHYLMMPLSGAGAPGASTGNGYPLGTTYADTTNDVAYVLVDNTASANVWDATRDTHILTHSGGVNPIQDTWRTWHYTEGPYNTAQTSWNSASGSSGTGSRTIDPTVNWYHHGLYIPRDITITGISSSSTPSGAHSSHDLYLEFWAHTTVDGATADPTGGAVFKVANVNFTVDGTTNKHYKKTYTIDNGSIPAGHSLNLYFTTTSAAGTGVKQRYSYNIEYTVD